MSETVQIILIVVIAILVVLFVFRRKLKIFKFKAGKEGVDLSLETYDPDNQKLAEEAKKVIPSSVAGTDVESGIRSNLLQLAAKNPRRAIIESWDQLEIASMETVKRKDIKFSKGDPNYRKKLQDKLEEERILDREKTEIFEKLRNKRNAAKKAEGSYDSEFTPESAINYIKASARLEEYLKTL